MAGSGVGLSELVRFSTEKGLGGLSFLAGIPGTVGGAIKTNAGAWGQAVSGILCEVEIMDRTGRVSRISGGDIRFGYRCSDIRDDTIILAGRFRLLPGSYEEINNNVKAVLEKRRDRFPAGFPSAGSVFKNPGNLSAGELIDGLGLKGSRFGRAMVSDKHANIIVNLGGAKAADVKGLMEYVKGKVYTETGINLEPEIECWA